MPEVEPREQWDFYVCHVDDQPCVVGLDLALADVTPIAELPHLLCIRLPLLAPRPDGLSTPEESDALGAIERDLIAAVGERCGGRLVGRMTWAGKRELVFYAERRDDVDAAVEDGLERAGGRAAEARVAHDPQWTFFDETIWPDRREYQWILDRRVVDGLESHGDQCSVPRQVDHYVYFEDAACAEAFAVEAGQRGFAADLRPEGKGDAALCVHLVRQDSVDLPHIHEVVCELIDLADRHDGDYDGWGAAIARQ